MNEQAIRFRLGVFVFAALLILALLITLFGRLPNIFKQTASYQIIFPSANGLAIGSPVRKSGVKIGEVRSVQLDDLTGKVNIGIEIDKDITLRQSDRPTLQTALLGGDAFIAFVPPDNEKKLDPTPVQKGAVLQGDLPPDPVRILQKTSELLPPAEEAIVEIKRVFEKLDQGALDPIAKTFRQAEKMMPLVEDTTKQIRSTAKEFEGVGKDTRQTIPEIRQTNDELKKLLRSANEVMPTLDKTLREAEGTARELSQLSKAGREMVPELRQTNDELKKLLKNANDTWPAVNRELAELEATTRLFGKFAERANLILQMNEEPFTKTVAALQKTFEGTASLLNDKNLRMIEEMLREMRVASRRLDPVLANVDELANESRAAVRQANKAFATLDDTLRDIKRMTGSFSETAPGMVKNFNESSVMLNATLRDVRELIQAVGRNDGTVQRLLTDPGLYNNLNDAALMVTRILPRVDRALKDVETFADKIARHPESLGIGGAIRPSSGLKDSPTFGPYGPR